MVVRRRANETADCPSRLRLEVSVDTREAKLAMLERVVGQLREHIAAARKVPSSSSKPSSDVAEARGVPPATRCLGSDGDAASRWGTSCN